MVDVLFQLWHFEVHVRHEEGQPEGQPEVQRIGYVSEVEPL